MLDLSTDPRTAQAYSRALARCREDPVVGLPAPRGAPVDLVGARLGAEEVVRWLSWGCEVRDGPTGWWVVVLTDVRLLGVSPVEPWTWEFPVCSWSVGTLGTDVVLDLPVGPPLRIRGSIGAAPIFQDPPAAEPPDAGSPDVAGTWVRRQAAQAPGSRPRRPRRRWVRRRWMGLPPPRTVWDMADRCVKCGRPLTDPRSRQARVGTKCIRVYGSQQRRVPNPEHQAWVARKTRAQVELLAAKAAAEAEYRRAMAGYDEARAHRRAMRHRG